eukprot:scaffold3337_cov95-Cylindrotheca_fusiformis.AAC.10
MTVRSFSLYRWRISMTVCADFNAGFTSLDLVFPFTFLRCPAYIFLRSLLVIFRLTSLNNSTWCPPAPPSLKAQNSFSCSSTMEESENEETVPHHEDNETIPHDDDEEEGNNGIVPLREFVRDDTKVAPGAQSGFILFLAEEVIQGFDVKTHAVYSRFCEMRKHKKFFFSVLTKPLIANEARRRSPKTAFNVTNKTKAEMAVKMRSIPLSEDDKEFIREQESRIRRSFERLDEESASPATSSRRSGYETFKDRLRFVSLFDIDELKTKYLASQSSWDRDSLDRRNSPTRETTFWEAAVQQFNDPEWIVETEAMPALHGEFIEPIKLKKGGYTLDIKKAKNMIQKMRPKIESLNNRYGISGNGANQRVPTDESSEDGGTGRPKEWRRYDEERAELYGGDDRSNFLGAECPSLLYWFHILDIHQLIGFTCAQLSKESAASSHAIPAPIAPSPEKRNRRKRKAAVESAAATKKFRRNVIKEMSSMSADMCKLHVVSRQQLLNEKEAAMTAYLKDKNISTDDEDDDAFVPSRRLIKIREDVAWSLSILISCRFQLTDRIINRIHQNGPLCRTMSCWSHGISFLKYSSADPVSVTRFSVHKQDNPAFSLYVYCSKKNSRNKEEACILSIYYWLR